MPAVEGGLTHSAAGAVVSNWRSSRCMKPKTEVDDVGLEGHAVNNGADLVGLGEGSGNARAVSRFAHADAVQLLSVKVKVGDGGSRPR